MLNEMMNYLQEPDLDDIKLTVADESAIFLASMQEACTPEEYNTLVMENLTALEMYGLIDSAEVATEAQKIMYKKTKQQTMTAEQNKAVMRMAKRLNLPEYQKYRKYIKLAFEEREKLRRKLGAKAKVEVKRSMSSAKRKASSMNGGANSDQLMKKIKERADANKKN